MSAEKPELTIVGGQPPKERRVSRNVELEVPVGIEMLLYQAARDPSFRRRLLRDRSAALSESGFALRPTEKTTLEAIPNTALASMIERMEPKNPRNQGLMAKVATVAATVAAGTAACTVLVSCDDPKSEAAGGAAPTAWPDQGPGQKADAGVDSANDSKDRADGGSGERGTDRRK